MSTTAKISISVSLLITLFFVLPWISLFQEVEFNLERFVPDGTAYIRLQYLVISTFLISLFLFQYNFHWKDKLFKIKKNWLKVSLDLVSNILLVLILTVLLFRITSRLFEVEPRKVYLTLYLFRHLGTDFVVMIVVYVYNLVIKSRSDKIRILTLNKEKAETELAMLKSQIDPHFLFNALNSLTGLIRTNSREAIKFVNSLSEAFRYTLDNQKQQAVTLREELDFLNSYLYMMKTRFGDALRVKTEVKDVHLDKRLPQFALQLLVENAVKHNLVSQSNPLNVSIVSNDEKLTVQNDLQLKSQVTKQYGIGLANLSKRYDLIAGSTIEIERNEHYFRVKLPLL